MPRNGVLTKTIKLDLGCGSSKADGWVGMDIASLPGVDIVHDLLKFPWPIASESVSEVRALHVLEHIPMRCMCCADQPDPLLATFDELWRILIPGGTAFIDTPHSSSVRAWQDPTHCRGINEQTYLYASREWRKLNRVDHYAVTCDFSATWAFITDSHGMVMDIQATLTKLP